MTAITEVKRVLEKHGYKVYQSHWEPGENEERTNPVILLWGPRFDFESEDSGIAIDKQKIMLEVVSHKKDFWDGIEQLERHKTRIRAIFRKEVRSTELASIKFIMAELSQTGSSTNPAVMSINFNVKTNNDLNSIATMQEANNG